MFGFGKSQKKKQEAVRKGGEKFQKLAGEIKQIERTTDEEALKLYAHFKQALFGDNEEDAPGRLDFVGQAKHNAWLELKGTAPESAEAEYLQFGFDLLAKYRPEAAEEFAAQYKEEEPKAE
ncbi:acyl-CoA binding protein [Ascodesmis nigricans]|uniref:Acyl-CoA binding protein n=1 Tax=Ascodesmis nigricans TaxID=341454 RepID=A0A4S2MY20_9PEZI|nr:acyl-CoA binding protein [Ascodesmis nigricans]